MTYQASLRDNVFRSSQTVSTTRVAVSGLTRQEIVWVLPEAATEAQKQAWWLHLMTVGTSTSDDRAVWRTFVLTAVHAAFPALGNQVLAGQPKNYKVHVVASADLKAMEEGAEMRSVWAEIPAADAKGADEARMETHKMFPTLEGLPPVTSASMTAEQGQSMQVEAIYGYVSLILFLAGKNINDRNRGAITIKRPNAVERKYGLGAVACLTGTLKLSNQAHVGINLAFTAMHHARAEIFKEVARFSHETGDYGVEVAATTTRLMAYSGMQHVVLIDKYLSATPHAEKIPVLAASLVAYASSLRELEGTPVDQRPFFKLIKGDTTRAFNRKDVETLLVVAITTEMEVNPTLVNYNLPDNSDDIMTVYRESLAHISFV